MRRTLPLLLATACGDPSSPSQDVTTYAEVIASAGQDPERELKRCETLGDAELRADCAAVVAVAAARRDGQVSRWCGRVPEGRWRDECTFQAAESALVTSGSQAAAALCQRSGQFAADCLVHVWQPQLGRITDRMGTQQFGTRYSAADALYQRSLSQVGDTPAFETAFWFSFFGAGFRNGGRVDMGTCEGLPELGRQRCQRAAALLLTEPLEGILRSRGQLQAFCSQSNPDTELAAALLGIQPSEALDQALAAQQPMICGGGGVPALSAGLRTTPASVK